MKDLIDRQATIDALCAVCGKACDKSKFVYNAPQDEQVILCPEHYCLCTLPSAQPEMIREIRKWINSGNRGNADYFIVDKIEEIINKYEE